VTTPASQKCHPPAVEVYPGVQSGRSQSVLVGGAVGTDDGGVAGCCADDWQEIPSFTHTFRQIFNQNLNDLTDFGISITFRAKAT
jgi:hypothetical protein